MTVTADVSPLILKFGAAYAGYNIISGNGEIRFRFCF